mgnify:CR=1 FL=1
MLPIAEDLGIMPKEARGILKHLGIAGTRLTRWVKYWEEDSSFIRSEDFDLFSVTTLSSHDTSSFDEWWQQNPSEAALYASSRNVPFTRTLSYDGKKAYLEDAHQSASLLHINLLSEYLTAFPDLSPHPLSRINVPGTESEENWSMRYPITLETLKKHTAATNFMQQMASI